MIAFQRTVSENADFQNLVTLLDEDLMIRDGSDHEFYSQFNKTANIRNVVVCYVDNKPVGCGAFKEYVQGEAEIKRMFVLPEYRGRGIASTILTELEIWASQINYSVCILETGKNQPEAISLYKKAGYSVIANYGQYKNIGNSICMKKVLFLAS